jgi:hypothetical protein
MRSRKITVLCVAVFAWLVVGSDVRAEPIGTALTYQGQLKHLGVPVTGPVDFEFSIWTAETGGSRLEVVGPRTLNLVDGLFTAQIDFGDSAFTGDARWLEVRLKSPAGTQATLSPRQPITPAPYALKAKQAGDLELPFAATVDTAGNAVAVTQTGTGGVLSVNKTTGDEPALYAGQAGTGPCGQFAINSLDNNEAALLATSIGVGPSVHAKGIAGGAAVEGTALGTGRAAYFHTELPTNDNPTVYAEQKGTGRCGHYRITNANNSLTAMAASTTGDGVAVSGYTIGEGSAGKFEINNAGSEAAAVVAKTNGGGYAVSAESASDAALSGGGTMIVGAPGGLNVVLDKNEIMARNNGGTSTLYINIEGGDVKFGGAIDIGYEIVNQFSSGDAAEAQCPAGKKAIGGGCNCGTDDVEGSYPIDEGDGWACYCSGDLTSALVICATVK